MKKLIIFLAAVFAGLFAAQNAGAYTAIWGLNPFNSTYVAAENNAQAAIASASNACNNVVGLVPGNTCTQITVIANTCYALLDNGNNFTPRSGRYLAFADTASAARSAATQMCNDGGEAMCDFPGSSSNGHQFGCDESCTGANEIAGAAMCETCPTGMVANGDNDMCVCPAGQTLVRGTTDQCETRASLSCAPGRFINGNRCEDCQGNTVSPGGEVKQCTPCTGVQIANANNSACEDPPAPPPPPTPEPKDNAAQTRALIGMGALVLSGALIHGGGIFTFSPDYAFSHNGLLSYGGKLQYQNGNFSAFWSGGENNGGFYSEGIEYAQDFWRAGYTAKLQDAEADWDVYANMEYGILRSGFNVGYISDADSDALSLSWQNRMEWQYADWQITPSANLFWRQGETDADTANFRVNLRREF